MTIQWPPYTQEQLDKLIKDTVNNTMQLMKSKGAEYAHGNDRLDNFRRLAAIIGIPPEIVWMVYANKHWDSITTWVKDVTEGRQRKYSEDMSGRFDDMINYCVLGKAMLQAREEYMQASLNLTDDAVKAIRGGSDGF